eukprot:scaffold81271_cov23-Cyclotella_meneghiniana.AAC.1
MEIRGLSFSEHNSIVFWSCTANASSVGSGPLHQCMPSSLGGGYTGRGEGISHLELRSLGIV